ncbi:DUF2188 domain-containing protein [Zhihengliuella salsuginis]|uniref:DUF2188 domain-containing protein n=1 Tax=Zhihengliuella salsuginis TaxID=578222 RepID=A0ABQ3GJG8_9MICC|nr:DUF2188 domain-containing protein [Zhihengliuella salsuginis]GHD06266.1 hypothetical protein GCM10008096_16060 [Zhihengliuella salsuginis]
MAQNADVYRDGDQWVGKIQGNSRASFRADTQAQAYNDMRDSLQRRQGGEISIHDRKGEIRDKHTVSPANDPRKTKG